MTMDQVQAEAKSASNVVIEVKKNMTQQETDAKCEELLKLSSSAKSEVLYLKYLHLYQSFVAEVKKVNPTLQVVEKRAASFDSVQALTKNFAEVKYDAKVMTLSEVGDKIKLLKEKLNSCVSEVEYFHYKEVLSHMIEEVSKEHSDYKLSVEEITKSVPSFAEVLKVSSSAKAVSFNVETITKEESMKLISEYKEKIYSAKTEQEFLLYKRMLTDAALSIQAKHKDFGITEINVVNFEEYSKLKSDIKTVECGGAKMATIADWNAK
jgi:hypothetical protein